MEFVLARGSKSKALFDLTGDIVTRIQIMGNKFLHLTKSLENIREKVAGRGLHLWNGGWIGSIQRMNNRAFDFW